MESGTKVRPIKEYPFLVDGRAGHVLRPQYTYTVRCMNEDGTKLKLMEYPLGGQKWFDVNQFIRADKSK